MQVRYEADGTPFHETTCYCMSCRRAVGAASVAWFSVERTTFRWIGAAPASFRSSAKVTRRFCGRCGTSLSYESDDYPGEIDITIASLDDPAALPPKDHTREASKLPWVRICDDLPAYPASRPGRR